ncbi:hypothetical protein Tco_0044991 [Tanacetum coccineum]
MAGSDNDSDDASVHSEPTIPQQQRNIQPQIITTISNNNAKFPYLKIDDLKRTRRDYDGRVIILPPTTADEHIAVQRESKARTTLLQSIPDDHVADFHYMDDARDIWNAVKARFGGNAESKKMRKSMLKQEFSEFRISEAEGLHKGYDRMQKILSQLNQLKAKPEDEDINLKFLRALPSSWSQVALTLKTKGGLELLSFDDLYYKLKTLEVDIKGYSTFSSSQSAGPSHSAFVSTTSASKKMSYADSPSYTSSTYTVPSISKTGSHRSGNVIEDVLQSFVADTEPEQQLAYEDFDQIEKLDLEEMDLKWQMAMLSVRVHKFEQKAGRKIDFETDSMKVVPPPLLVTTLLFRSTLDLVESQNVYVNSIWTLPPVIQVFKSSGRPHHPKSNDSTSYASTSSISTSESKAEIESFVGTPIQETINVQDLPSFSCNSSDKNGNTSRTSCNKNDYINKKAGHFRKNASSVSMLCLPTEYEVGKLARDFKGQEVISNSHGIFEATERQWHLIDIDDEEQLTDRHLIRTIRTEDEAA